MRIETWPELEAYMDGSAGSVGRIMAPLLGVPERHHAGYGRLGLAFQLANFIRDVREDTRLDRVYLPAEDRARFGVDRGGPRAAQHASPELRALLAHEVRRARALFAESRAGDRRRARLGARAACASPSRSTCACSTASSGSTSTCSAGAPACAPWQVPRRARSGRLRR